MSDSHIKQAREWMDAHELIPGEQCGYRLSQTVEQCHAYQRVRGRCPFECEHRLNNVGKLKPGHAKFNQRGVCLVDAGK
jgi:hypothetical protein